MAKIQPLPASSSSPCSSCTDHRTVRKQVYTVWMKSLVFNGNGCTVYGSDGQVAFRVDNYDCKGSREVFFMDRCGRTLIHIQRKSFGMFKRWEGRRYYEDTDLREEVKIKPWFTVQKARKVMGSRGGSSEVTVRLNGGGGMYTICGCPHKSDYRISDASGGVVAEIGRKRTASGVALGEDVLYLTVGPTVDPLLILGLVVVCGLMNNSM